MNKPLKLVFAIALLTIAGALSLQGKSTVYSAPNRAPNDTITLTQPAPNTTIAEADDYATQVLGDPWDMTSDDSKGLNGLNDLAQPHDYTAPPYKTASGAPPPARLTAARLCSSTRTSPMLTHIWARKTAFTTP